MRHAAFACALVLVAGLAVVGVQALTRDLQPARPITPSADAPGLDANSPGDEERVMEEGIPAPNRRSRSSRRRSYNRYPGPIPTPNEWEPPAGPVRIALQAGHWKANEAPRELSGIRDNGTRWGNMLEWEANLAIAQRAGALLEELGYEVDILPAVVPPRYRAHLFISIHADGSGDPNASGFRITGPRSDATGRADGFADLLRESYGGEAGLARLPTVTHRMENYYAFNFRRYEHALHPMTIGVILETGFLTSARDRRVIVDDPDRAARGIVEAVKAFPVTPPPRQRPPG
ncbi:N-acetylmuramoyl-L-alanine amidase [Gemmatimonadota bacterium]